MIRNVITIQISGTIEDDYATRLPEHLPLEKLNEGVCTITVEEAHIVLADAEFNSDPNCIDIGTNGTPLGTYNSYKALAAQIRKKLAELGRIA